MKEKDDAKELKQILKIRKKIKKLKQNENKITEKLKVKWKKQI